MFTSWVSLRSLPGEKPPQPPPPAGRRRPATVLAHCGPRVPGGPCLCGAVCTGRITHTHIHTIVCVISFMWSFIKVLPQLLMKLNRTKTHGCQAKNKALSFLNVFNIKGFHSVLCSLFIHNYINHYMHTHSLLHPLPFSLKLSTLKPKVLAPWLHFIVCNFQESLWLLCADRVCVCVGMSSGVL